MNEKLDELVTALQKLIEAIENHDAHKDRRFYVGGDLILDSAIAKAKTALVGNNP